ncbi:hypothetical protein FGO68_gene1556 [Halteria grandinella]|uniref:Uncharacterized protein n=1 Tax=Halteria grandinella TaxID=5974 RepID=A0A8J8SVM7_HALGN|nr:hypothetical protein FGO68_gene1556 [Halteria grandinella]
MDIISYLTLGLLSSSYPTFLLNPQKELNLHIENYLIKPLEFKLRNPLIQDVSPFLGKFGMALNQKFCMYPSYMMMLREGFDSYFEANELHESQQQLNWNYQQNNKSLTESQKIPQKVHYVWITKDRGARNPFSDYEQRDMLLKSLEVLNQSQWEINLWTNNLEIVPDAWEYAQCIGLNVLQLSNLSIQLIKRRYGK